MVSYFLEKFETEDVIAKAETETVNFKQPAGDDHRSLFQGYSREIILM